VAGLVVAGWVEGQVAKDLADGGADDANSEIVDEYEDGLVGVGEADADANVNLPRSPRTWMSLRSSPTWWST
jgi:hypothetical protein